MAKVGEAERIDAGLSVLLVVQALTLFVVLPLGAAHPGSRVLLDICHLAFAAVCVRVIVASGSNLLLADPGAQTARMTYFSLYTITTTGCGDVVPVHPIARSLANLEAVFGQLFPATLLARLVTLHLAHDGEPADRARVRD